MYPEAPTRFLDSETRLKHGLERERQIAVALVNQAGLPIKESTGDEDKTDKIDRWLETPTGKVGIQIKYRETGDDLLFEVWDTFHGWGDPRNKPGRDVQGKAKQYAVLLKDCKTVVMIPNEKAKEIISGMERDAILAPFRIKTPFGWIHRQFSRGFKLELRVQRDPANQRPKMVAYIPPDYFGVLDQIHRYKVKLPHHWK